MKKHPQLFVFYALFLCFINNMSGFCQTSSVVVSALTCEHKANPVGIDVATPRLSWILQSTARNQKQTAYQIRVATSENFDKKYLVWDSNKKTSAMSVLVSYDGMTLKSSVRYFWQVKIWDAQGVASAWSAVAFWEMGLLAPTDWQAKWIEPAVQQIAKDDDSPAPMVRKEFTIKNKIASARAYVTSHGFYELHLNGQKVGNQELTPGWTSYHKRLQYQTYDITAQLRTGSNAVGAFLGEGWYRSPLGWEDNIAYYGKRLGLRCQIHLKYANGSEEIISSDGTWKYTNNGPIRINEIYDGEAYDATRELKGWAEPNFDDAKWATVQVANFDNETLIAPQGVPTKRIEEIKPIKIFRTPKGLLVADMGQNMVGWIRLKISGTRGTKITLRHAEVLDKFGDFYLDNLRSAKVKATYTLNGSGEEVFEPRFTFMGFRFVSIEGAPSDLTASNITGVVVHSDMKPTGTFTCSNALVNQLQHNILWGQKGNFVDIPTDCPQRDERLGWTGDAQAFCRTAAYNMNVAAFFTKWLKDVAADQRPDGSVPFVSPDILNKMGGETVPVSAGWADVAVIAPWTMYQVYGDKRILETQYPSMKAYVEYQNKKSENYLWKNGSIFGDWLFYRPAMNSFTEPDGFTNKDYICAAFFGYSTSLLREAARALGKTDDVSKYDALFENIKKSFNAQYVSAEGRIASDSQTAYVLALMFDLLPQNLRAKATNHLVEDIKSRKNHLSTGFLGTPYLCHVLSQNGRADVGYDLLLQESYPSWLYPIKMGATTIWERWDGQKTDSTFQDTGMNSFNHYAYGAVGDWMYRVVAGIEIDPTQPGYKHFFIQPQLTDKLSYATATLQSNYGEIASGWQRQNGKVKMTVKIPANTTATVKIPHASLATITERGSPLQENFPDAKPANGLVELTVGSGDYVFEF